MKLFEKLFCKHKWKSHIKEVYNWRDKVDGTWDTMNNYSSTTEILICQECGKIKKIEY